VVEAEPSPKLISNSFSSAFLLSIAADEMPVWTRRMPGEKKSSSSLTGLTTGSGPVLRGVGVGETDLARTRALETSIGGVWASSPPSPMTTGGASANVTLRPLALPRPFDNELTDWLRP
jgi:hypothetical protein